jgi:endonuclease YncB( thermonuclease family)
MPTLRLLVCFIACISAHASADPKPLVTLKNCTFVDTEWADGDSFQLKAPDGKLMTARLYAADCVELHINTDSDKRRLRDQRRHFGITEVKGDKQSSVSLATAFGKGARVVRSFSTSYADRISTCASHPQSQLRIRG